MDKDKEYALHLIAQSQKITHRQYGELRQAEKSGQEVMSRMNNVRGWNYKGKFYSNPEFIKKALKPK